MTGSGKIGAGIARAAEAREVVASRAREAGTSRTGKAREVETFKLS